jgi:glycosyltransferase involved in cell wall biosynthesis
MKLSIVIPCYNESKTIRTIVDRVRAAPVAEKEIIIVDDCSRDGTRDVLRTQIAPLVDRIIYHDINRRNIRDCSNPSPMEKPTSSSARVSWAAKPTASSISGTWSAINF